MSILPTLAAPSSAGTLTPLAPEPAVSGHIPALDGLRGIAILMVLVHHFTERPLGLTLVDRIFREFTSVGWAGVDLFFALSGFLITGILLRSRGKPRCLRNFFARRTLRIFPLYYFVLLALFVVWPLLAVTPESYEAFREKQSWYWTYTTNWLFAQQLPHPRYNTAHFWSLAVEEQFYLIWPFVVAFARPRTLKTICVVAFVAALGFRAGCLWQGLGPSPAYILTVSRMDALLAGSFVAIAVSDEQGRARLARLGAWLLPVCLLALITIVVGQGNLRRGDLMLTLGFTVLATFNAILVGMIALGRPRQLARICDCPVLRFFGKYSYGIYVYHAFVVAWLKDWFPVSSFPSPCGTGLVATLAFTATGILISTVCALVSWAFLERPINGLKRYFPT